MSDYTSWYVGMKVVCIVPADKIAIRMKDHPGSRYPHHNGIYTIREIRDDAQWDGGVSHIVLLLEELDNRDFIGRSGPGWRCYVEPGFPVRGFRPVETRKTDISIFKRLLTPTTRETA